MDSFDVIVIGAGAVGENVADRVVQGGLTAVLIEAELVGGEVIAAMLAKVGIVAKQENVEWAQWLSGVYGQKAYDLTLVSHVEPLDFGNFARPGYYWNYESTKFNELWARVNATADTKQRHQLLAELQRLVADDAVAAYLYQPTWITVSSARLKGIWKDMPIFANDLSALSWA